MITPAKVNKRRRSYNEEVNGLGWHGILDGNASTPWRCAGIKSGTSTTIKGHPTYVAIWEIMDKEIRLIEVTYAGTHEKAPY